MKKVKMGIIAPGKIAGSMARTMEQMNQVERYAVASRNIERASAFAKKYGFQHAYGSYEEMLQDPELELVYIASPHSHHYEHIKLCLNHGKHVLCEKSFTVNTKQAEEVLQLAKEKELLVTEAMWVRYMPMARTLQEIIQSGILGEIVGVNANLCYDIEDKTRIMDPTLAGGALLDVGVYTLTFASLVMGNKIEQIHAAAIKSDTGVDLQTNITLCYEGNKMASLLCGTRAISDRMGMVYGKNGYVIVQNINNFERIDVYDINRTLIHSYECPTQITGYEYQVEACVEAIQNGWLECPQMPHEETMAIMKQMDEIRNILGIHLIGDEEFSPK